jgi:hypothetical protein
MPAGPDQLDRYYAQISARPRSVVADIESLLFRTGTFELVFCIGSVLNYVSAIETISELARVTTTGGHLFLHFETSSSFEQIATVIDIGANTYEKPVDITMTAGARRDQLGISGSSPEFQAPLITAMSSSNECGREL